MKYRLNILMLFVLTINPFIGNPVISRSGLSHIQPVSEDGIFLRDITLLPGQSEPAAPEDLSRSLAAEEGFWLVQFAGPTLPEWREALFAAGLEIVTYVPENAYVVYGTQPAAAVEEVAINTGAVQYSGAYLPLYRLSPALRPLAMGDGAPSAAPIDETQHITVQFYQTDRLAASIRALEVLSTRVILPPEPLLNTTIMRVEISAQALADLANWPDVLNIEPYSSPELLDEIQGQILAGNLLQRSGTLLPYAPGYLDWLRSKGFPTQPNAYPLVDVMDDGVDSGNVANVLHPDFYLFGNNANISRVEYMKNCTGDPSGNGTAGHGNLNAGIVAGYNDRQGAPFQDAQGYHLGLGISPFGRVASTKVFNNAGRFSIERCNNSLAILINAAYSSGARITSNSWGRVADAAYTTESQMYDAFTRDASQAAGLQEMLHIFAAGNSGPGRQTISTPGTAKNVLTVGATENVRDNGVVDGCNIADANSADDVADYSSRGPTGDGRAKPDILAPGTHVQGQASQVLGYSGLGVCGGYQNSQINSYYPVQQTLYTWSSGTSHATPAISGVAQLATNYYSRVLRPGQNPSPAMLKALILDTPRYMQGSYAGDWLPSPDQGWGSADMSKMFDQTPRILEDQAFLITEPGQVFTTAGEIFNPSQPLHITLVWSDAPGSPIAQRALVNDLDLEVSIDGETYLGNNFAGSQSVTGGSADRLNNIENIFLPAGLSGSFEVRVIARNLAGDGVPGNGTPFDQDFALVVYNSGTQEPTQNSTLKYFMPLVGGMNPDEMYPVEP